MRALIQRVSRASVAVDGQTIGAIDHGLLALIGVEKDDDTPRADKLLHKLLHYRVFSDDAGKMNRDLRQVDGGLLLVSQFTLAADTGKGLRPSFSSAAPPDQGTAAIRLPARHGAPGLATRRLWRVRCRDAGRAGQRRSGDLSAGNLRGRLQNACTRQYGVKIGLKMLIYPPVNSAFSSNFALSCLRSPIL